MLSQDHNNNQVSDCQSSSFTILLNSILFDDRISYDARLVVWYVISRRSIPGWEFKVDDIRNHIRHKGKPMGIRIWERISQELHAVGYLKAQNVGGKNKLVFSDTIPTHKKHTPQNVGSAVQKKHTIPHKTYPTKCGSIYNKDININNNNNNIDNLSSKMDPPPVDPPELLLSSLFFKKLEEAKNQGREVHEKSMAKLVEQKGEELVLRQIDLMLAASSAKNPTGFVISACNDTWVKIEAKNTSKTAYNAHQGTNTPQPTLSQRVKEEKAFIASKTHTLSDEEHAKAKAAMLEALKSTSLLSKPLYKKPVLKDYDKKCTLNLTDEELKLAAQLDARRIQ